MASYRMQCGCPPDRNEIITHIHRDIGDNDPFFHIECQACGQRYVPVETIE